LNPRPHGRKYGTLPHGQQFSKALGLSLQVRLKKFSSERLFIIIIIIIIIIIKIVHKVQN